jgi:cardiolipin synthase
MSLRWIPNLISLARIAMVPMVVGAIATQRIQLALGLFFIAGFSDGLDGFLARRFRWHTPVGAILDPIADKLLMIGTFVTLAIAGLIPAWLAALVIARDVIIMGGAILYHFLFGDLEGNPTRISKLNTALELLYVIIALAMPLVTALPAWLPRLFEAVLIVTITVSGASYVISGIRRARQRSNR